MLTKATYKDFLIKATRGRLPANRICAIDYLRFVICNGAGCNRFCVVGYSSTDKKYMQNKSPSLDMEKSTGKGLFCNQAFKAFWR